jgi:hypothetical protein
MQPTGNASALPRDHAQDDACYQFAGLLVVALFPALFWTAVAAGIGAAIGSMPTPAALMTFGAAVATFCGVVAQTLFSRS